MKNIDKIKEVDYLEEAFLGELRNSDGQLYGWAFDSAKIMYCDLPETKDIWNQHILMTKEEYEVMSKYHI